MVNVAVINIKSLIKILLIIFVVIFFIYFVQGLSINLDKFAFSPFILNPNQFLVLLPPMTQIFLLSRHHT